MKDEEVTKKVEQEGKKAGREEKDKIQEWDEEVLEKFRDPEMLNLIHKELSKKHIKDDYEKMAVFLTSLTGFLKRPKQRRSIALKGASSVGKDNLIDTVLTHLPEKETIKLTRATSSVLEDDINKYNIVAFSEMNKNRKRGVNKFIVENLKQLAEGGSHALKKDVKEGFKETLDVEQEQKTVIYGTTETRSDKELDTRFITVSIEGYPSKIEAVNKNTIQKASNVDSLIDDVEDENSWIRRGLKCLDYDYKIWTPYAYVLEEEVNGKSIINHNKPRSQRDLKRLLSIIKSLTLLHQKQREKITYKGQKLLVSSPEDIINAVNITSRFFNESFTGVTPRLRRVLEFMHKEGGVEIERGKIQKALDVTVNTVRKYCRELENQGLIREVKIDPLQRKYFSIDYDIYKKSRDNKGKNTCKDTCKRGVIRVKVETLINLLNEEIEKKNNMDLQGVNRCFYTPKIDKTQLWGLEKDFSKKGVNTYNNMCKNEKNSENSKKSSFTQEETDFDRVEFTGSPTSCNKCGLEFEPDLLNKLEADDKTLILCDDCYKDAKRRKKNKVEKVEVDLKDNK